MKHLYLFFLAYNISILSYSQSQERDINNFLEYYPERHKAYEYFKEEKYEQAYFLLKKLYDKYGTDIAIEDNSYVTYVRAAELSNQCFSRFKAVKFLIEKCGYDDTPLKYKNHDLYETYIKSGIDKEYIEILRKRYLKKINMSLRKHIIKMVERDQLYRRGYRGKDKLKKLDSIDEINEKLLIKVFEKYGYPNHRMIGNYWVDEKHVMLSSVLRHTSDSIKINYFLPKIYDFINKGETTPKFYNSMLMHYKKKHLNICDKLNTINMKYN